MSARGAREQLSARAQGSGASACTDLNIASHNTSWGRSAGTDQMVHIPSRAGVRERGEHNAHLGKQTRKAMFTGMRAQRSRVHHLLSRCVASRACGPSRGHNVSRFDHNVSKPRGTLMRFPRGAQLDICRAVGRALLAGCCSMLAGAGTARSVRHAHGILDPVDDVHFAAGARHTVLLQYGNGKAHGDLFMLQRFWLVAA